MKRLGSMTLLCASLLWCSPSFATPAVSKLSPASTRTATKTTPLPKPRQAKLRGSVQLRVHVVNMSRQKPPGTTKSSRIKHLPLSLLTTYGYNSFASLKRWVQVRPLQRAAMLSLNPTFKFRIKPLTWNKKEKSIRLKTTLLRKEDGPGFQRTVQTILRLRQGRTMAFLGPPLQSGRLLLLLSATYLP